MDQEFFSELRAIERERLHEIWKCVKDGDLDELSDEEQVLARIMLEHEDEYSLHFEFTDAVLDYDYKSGEETNPFLHITFHAIVENQLVARDPIEVYQFYNAMMKKKTSRHETIHLIGRILANFLFDTMKYKQPFDRDGYTRLLKKLKNKRPEKIWDFFEQEPE